MSKISRSAKKFGTGPAYDTNKGPFKYKVDVTFRFDKVEKSLRDVRRDIVRMNDAAFKMQKQLKKTDKGFGVYIDAITGSKNKARPIDFRLPQRGPATSPALEHTLKRIGEKGRDIMKKYMRVDSGKMKQEVRYMQRRRGNQQAQVQVGWVRTWYKYFAWQEFGTRTGIKPMNSLSRTYMELLPYANREMSKFTRKYFLEGDRR